MKMRKACEKNSWEARYWLDLSEHESLVLGEFAALVDLGKDRPELLETPVDLLTPESLPLRRRHSTRFLQILLNAEPTTYPSVLRTVVG